MISSRGDVFWVDYRYREPNCEVDISNDRPVACLLTRQFSEATGGQLVIVGTKKTQASHQRGGEAPPGESEFPSPWTYKSLRQHSPAQGRGRRQLWKANRLLVSPSFGPDSYRGEVAAGWEGMLLEKLKPFLDDEVARGAFESPAKESVHPLARRLKPGSIIRYGNRLAFVLSSEAAHRLSAYGTILCAPVIPNSTLTDKAAKVGALGNSRVAYENVQTIEPLTDEAFEIMEEPSLSTGAVVSCLRSSFLRYISGEAPAPISPKVFLRYLTESRLELEAQSLSPHLGIAKQVTGYGTRSDRHSRVIAPTGSTFTAPTGIAGHDTFRVALTSDVFAFSLERRESQAFLIAELRHFPGDRFQGLWVENLDGHRLADPSENSVDLDGIVEVPLGDVTPDSRLQRRIVAFSSEGVDDFVLDIEWTTATRPPSAPVVS